MECTQEMSFWLDVIVKLTPASVSMVVGGFGTYIAFNQYRTNRDKLRLDLFEKRLEAYEKLQEYFNDVLRNGCVEDKAIPILAEARYKSLFLFGNEITEYIDEVCAKMSEMRRLQLKLDGSNSLPVGEDRSRVCEEQYYILLWHLNQQKDSSKKYYKYLKFM
jgi:hypothetical protein